MEMTLDFERPACNAVRHSSLAEGAFPDPGHQLVAPAGSWSIFESGPQSPLPAASVQRRSDRRVL